MTVLEFFAVGDQPAAVTFSVVKVGVKLPQNTLRKTSTNVTLQKDLRKSPTNVILQKDLRKSPTSAILQ